MTMPADPHARLAQPEMAIDGHSLADLRDWLYAQLADDVPKADLRYLAGTTTDPQPPPYTSVHVTFTPGNRLFGVLVI